MGLFSRKSDLSPGEYFDTLNNLVKGCTDLESNAYATWSRGMGSNQTPHSLVLKFESQMIDMKSLGEMRQQLDVALETLNRLGNSPSGSKHLDEISKKLKNSIQHSIKGIKWFIDILESFLPGSRKNSYGYRCIYETGMAQRAAYGRFTTVVGMGEYEFSAAMQDLSQIAQLVQVH